MGEAEIEQLDQLFIRHRNTIHEVCKVLDEPPPSSQTKVSWDDVLELGEEIYKQATAVGMLWTGEGPDAKALEESMETYSNLLQRFLLLSHGNLIGAGATLNIDIRLDVQAVTMWSVALMKESVASYGNLL